MNWLEEYLLERKKTVTKKNQGIRFEFNLVYFNTVSAKYILEMLRLLHLSSSEGADIKIIWYFKAKDEDMKESGEEFAKLVNIPFEFIQQ